MQREPRQLGPPLYLVGIVTGIHLRQTLQQLLQPRDEITELVLHVIALLVGIVSRVHGDSTPTHIVVLYQRIDAS